MTSAFKTLLGDSRSQWKPFKFGDIPIRRPPGTPLYLAERDAIIAQFRVGDAPRYQPRDRMTFCNIFMSDVTLALGCEIPHMHNGVELTVNRTVRELRAGAFPGWTRVSTPFTGGVTLVTWFNPSGGPGHVAVVVGAPLPVRPIQDVGVAQAGAICGWFKLSQVFSPRKLLDVEYWHHD
jgi:hypothetical protein